MPRTATADEAGLIYHALNRGNGRATVFHDAADYDAFLALIDAACQRRPIGVLAFCLMPNHFHLALQPFKDGDLGKWMQWLLTSHVRQYRKRYGGSGHVWQGRFKAFPTQGVHHLVSMLRYIERNALRAGLVEEVSSNPLPDNCGGTQASCRRRRRADWRPPNSPIHRARSTLEAE